MTEPETLIPKHGGYRNLKSFQVAQLVYDVTVRFCDRYIDPRSRTHDQMVQAARSGVQNIAEGSQASGTSKKMEMKLTNVARASLEELRLDYEDYLRQRGLKLWRTKRPTTADELRWRRRCATADEVAVWVRKSETAWTDMDGWTVHGTIVHVVVPYSPASTLSWSPTPRLSCSGVATALLDRQLASQAAAFEKEGGFTERLYRVRSAAKKGKP